MKAIETNGPMGDMPAPEVTCDRPGPGGCVEVPPINDDPEEVPDLNYDPDPDADEEDPTADMMAWEDGSMDPRREVAFFQRLVDSGLVWSLQGMYGRRAQELINSGDVKLSGGER